MKFDERQRHGHLKIRLHTEDSTVLTLENNLII